MKNKFYKIKNKVIIGVDEISFNDYLKKHHFQAPSIPFGAKEIKQNIFNKIKKIEKIFLPTTILSIDVNCFAKFKNIIITYGDFYDFVIVEKDPYKNIRKSLKLTKIHDHKIFNNYLIKNDGLVPRIPNGIVFIGEYVFKNNSKIKDVILPTSTIAIYKQAFMNCYNLQNVQLSNLCCDFGEEVFKNCKSLKKMIIFKSMFSIRENVFKGCNNITIYIFEKYTIDLKEFLLDGSLLNCKNMECKNRNSENKVLITNNNYFIIYDSNTYKINKKDYPLNKESNNLIDYTESENVEINAINLLNFIKSKKKLPYYFIINNTIPDYVERYYNQYKSFEKLILKKIVKHFADKPLTNKQYEILYNMCIISGFFENNDNLKNKSINFIINYLFSIEKSNGLGLNLLMFEELFAEINGEYIQYNKEFSDTFLFNLNNLKSMINESLYSKNYTLIKRILSKCGKSNIYYLHNDVKIKSLGLLHDVYKNYNQNNKLSTKKYNFIEWVLKKNNFDNYITENDILTKKINLFYKYYDDINVIKKLIFIMNESEKVSQYIFYNINNPDIIVEKRKYNVASIYSKPKYREFVLCLKKQKEVLLSSDLMYTFKDRYISEITNKSNYLVAFSNCEFGTCANIGSSGAEYIYESYIDSNCQPFLIYDLNKGKKIIASFRINVNRNKGIGIINSLEVSKDVKYNYTEPEKKNIINAFYGIIIKFVKLYNKFNFNNKMKVIYLGCITHCGIDDVLEKRFTSININLKIDERVTISQTKNNYLIIWKNM